MTIKQLVLLNLAIFVVSAVFTFAWTYFLVMVAP